MTKDLDFDRTHHRAPRPVGSASLVKRQSCAVCGLRADCLICKECTLDIEASIKWLERLPQGDRVTRALELLREMR